MIYGIYASSLTVNSGTVCAYAGNTTGESVGILVNYDYTINGGCLYAEGKSSKSISVGLSANRTISFNGGKTEAVCDEESTDHIALGGATINMSNGMMITTPKGGKVGTAEIKGNSITTVLDGTTVAPHVIVTTADESDNDNADGGVSDLNSKKNSGKVCVHDYQWTVEREPTITEDGEEVYKCTKCGDISARQPLSAEGFCFLDAEGKVRNAKAGQTLKLNFKQWNSVPKAFFEQLAKRRDITVVIRFTYKHKTYEMTVTPDMAIDTSYDYYGPEKLIQLYGAKEVVTK
jgi:hypothetical protein